MGDSLKKSGVMRDRYPPPPLPPCPCRGPPRVPAPRTLHTMGLVYEIKMIYL